MPQVRWPAHRVDDAPSRPRGWLEVAVAHLHKGADPSIGRLEREAGDTDLRDRADRIATIWFEAPTHPGDVEQAEPSGNDVVEGLDDALVERRKHLFQMTACHDQLAESGVVCLA